MEMEDEVCVVLKQKVREVPGVYDDLDWPSVLDLRSQRPPSSLIF
jgi:hypothetical protein